MKQIKQECYKQIEKIFEKGNIFLDAFNNGEKEKVKNNLIVFSMGQRIDSEEKGVNSDMKNIRKRYDGRWEWRKVINGERICIASPTMKELLIKKREFLNSLKITYKHTKLLKNYKDEWFGAYKSNLSKKSKELYDMTFNNYILKIFGEYKPSELKASEIQTFVMNIKKLRTRELVIQHFKALLKYIYALGEMKIDISSLIVNNKTVEEQLNVQSRLPMTIKQQQKLLKQLNNYDFDIKAFITFSIILGTRRNETLAFRLDDISENNLVVHGTKTKSSARTIKISNSMIEFLKQKQIKSNERYFKFHQDTITNKVNEVLQEIDKNLTLHCLRKTCSTNMHYLGISDKIRQQVLGHSNIRTTNDIYTHLEFDIKKEDILEIYNTLYYDY